MDRYYRLVCVVYVGVDSGKLLNVNKWLLENNNVYLADFDNEFTCIDNTSNTYISSTVVVKYVFMPTSPILSISRHTNHL